MALPWWRWNIVADADPGRGLEVDPAIAGGSSKESLAAGVEGRGLEVIPGIAVVSSRESFALAGIK